MSNIPELLPAGEKNVQTWWMESFIKENEIFLVAKQDKQVVGYVMGESLSGRVAILHILCVDRKYRRNGIGKDLLAAFENECRNRKNRVTIVYAQRGPILSLLKNKGYSAGSRLVECEKRIVK